MPQGLLALPGAFQGFDEARLASALILAKADRGRSFFAGIHRLPAGHFLRVTPNRVECTSYWHPSDARPTRYARDEDYAEALLELFDRATAARMRSRGKLASDLSSGLDSSSVTASAAVQLPPGRRLQAYTAVPRPDFNGLGPVGRLVDEGPEAAEVAALYPNIDHRRLDTLGAELTPLVHRFTDLLGEPVQNSVHLLWIAAILNDARSRGVDVLLQGALGNGTISQSGTALFSDWLRSGRWLKLYRTAAELRERGQMSWKGAVRFATNGLVPMPLRKLVSPETRNFSLLFSAANPAMIQTHNLHQRALYDFYGNRPDEATERRNFFERFDFGCFNAANRAFAGIDARDPTSDKRIFDFCYSIPTEQYLAGGIDRSLVRRAMRHRLPQATLTRTLRGIQSADWYLSVADALPAFRQELPSLKLAPEAVRVLDLKRIEHLLNTWPATGYEHDDASYSWGDALCRGFSFGYFLSKSWAATITPPSI
jgi:asparagine synthase (glutamine-hydrolysing)